VLRHVAGPTQRRYRKQRGSGERNLQKLPETGCEPLQSWRAGGAAREIPASLQIPVFLLRI
jgi:hypothetical protein